MKDYKAFADSVFAKNEARIRAKKATAAKCTRITTTLLTVVCVLCVLFGVQSDYTSQPYLMAPSTTKPSAMTTQPSSCTTVPPVAVTTTHSPVTQTTAYTSAFLTRVL